MSIASEITRLQNSKADVKTQVNIDKDIINGGTAFVGNETLDDYDDKIEEMQEAYKKFIPIQTTSGTEIQLDNSSNDKALVDIGLDGNTEQTTYSGIQLFNKATAISGKGVSTSNGTLYNSTDNFATDYIPVTTGNYIASGYSSSANRVYGATYDSSKAYVGNIASAVGTKTFSIGSGVSYIRLTGLTTEIDTYQVQTGTTLGTYEPYTGGIASPNPDYPQEVKVVTGDNTVTVMGKNLLPINSQDLTINNVKFTVTNGILGIKGTASANVSGGDFKNDNWKVTLPAGTYTLSRDKQSYSVGLIDDANNTITSLSSASTSLYSSFTLNETKTMYLFFFISSGTVADTTYKLQLEQSSSATTFEPYSKTEYPISLASKNIFDYSSNMIASANIDSAQMKIVSDNSCKVSYVKCKPNTTYTISRRNPMSTRLLIATTESLPQVGTSLLSFVANYDDTTTSTTITTVANAHYIIVRFIYNEVNDYETYAKTIQVEKGSIATTYEEFWQIELAKISTYKDYLKKSTGKNLAKTVFDKKYNMSGSGNNRTVVNASNYQGQIIPVKSGTTYTASGIFTNFQDGYVRICMFDDLPTVNSVSTKFAYGSSPTTFTTDTNTKYILIFNPSNVDTTITNFQIEEGSSATSLEPYGKDKWYKYNAVGKYIANDDLTGNGTTTYTVSMLTPTLNVSASLSGDDLGARSKCNLMPTKVPDGISSGLSGTTSVNKIRVILDKNHCTDYTTANTFLKNNNLTIYYGLATPTVTEITDETLIEQLEAVKLLSGTQNNFTIDADTLPTLNLNYIGEANPHL